jgi:hypothetical protein
MGSNLLTVLDFMARMAFTVVVLYFLYAWLDFIYTGKNRFPRVFGALDRGTTVLLRVLMLAPIRRDRGE